MEPLGSYANIKNVRMSNYCDISLHFDMRNNRLIVCSVIDNMVKGAAGQAIQNMNIYFGYDEGTGLMMAPQEF
jgi:N-acetyl-gamma-glutamyl-phosphate reductase